MVGVFILFFILSGTLNSQNEWLPNAGFENWRSVGISEEPEFWGTLNQGSFLGGVVNVFKDSNAYEGNYALRLESKLHTNPVDSTTKVYSGIAGLNAVFSDNDLGYVDFGVKPIKINGYYKSIVNAGDSCIIYGLLQKWSNLNNEYIDVGVFYKSFTSNVTSWTGFESFVYYYGQERPDRLTMLIIAGDFNNPTSGNVLYLDALSFTYYASAIDDYVEVWPNTNISIPVIDNDEGMSLTINSVTTPSSGTNQILFDQIQYTPYNDFKGYDEVDYVICDGIGECDTGHVSIDVQYGLNIHNKFDKEIHISPNPASDKISLNIPKTYLPVSIHLYNKLGQLLMQKETDQIKNLILVNDFPKGNHSIIISNKFSNLLYNSKLTIQ